jgi:hypothetical protein
MNLIYGDTTFDYNPSRTFFNDSLRELYTPGYQGVTCRIDLSAQQLAYERSVPPSKDGK